MTDALTARLTEVFAQRDNAARADYRADFGASLSR
ncbi:Uncharacterised protein [Mycolicibacterium smegmatis]|nr:Uncharacterised protein [Mycolicibacterium smegmatis]STZ34765.1 Uncharacterised protein [Mycolicibacterium smegmatis]VTP10292.1 hypothetical protein BIN_B_04634 [Mycolicibacterium smegmatis]